MLTQSNHYSWDRDLDKFAWLMVTFFTLSTHQSSSVSFCRPLWVTPSRSSSSWRTLSVASVSLLLTSSLSSDRPCEERSSSYRTERQLWITVAGATAIRSQAGVYTILVMNHRWQDVIWRSNSQVAYVAHSVCHTSVYVCSYVFQSML